MVENIKLIMFSDISTFYETQILLSIKFYWHTVPLIHLCIDCGCFRAITGVVTETTWPTKPKIFTVWSFPEKAPAPSVYSVKNHRRSVM